VYRDGGISLAVFTKDNGNKSVKLQKSYKDKQTGKFVETNYFFLDELSRLATLIDTLLGKESEDNNDSIEF
jgi:hypothetical protein